MTNSINTSSIITITTAEVYSILKSFKTICPALLQVTVQQLWKQVYNTLGGNPRSTSAATCTRRHYEKWVHRLACTCQRRRVICFLKRLIWSVFYWRRLLLSYECHLTGILVNVLPRNQPKHFHNANFGKVHEDGQRPPKRKLPLMPLIPVGTVSPRWHVACVAQHVLGLIPHYDSWDERHIRHNK